MRDSKWRFTNFEHFLRSSTEDKKMYPSDRIWQNIHARIRLSRVKKWPELKTLSIGILLLHIVGTLAFKPNYHVLNAPFIFEGSPFFSASNKSIVAHRRLSISSNHSTLVLSDIKWISFIFPSNDVSFNK